MKQNVLLLLLMCIIGIYSCKNNSSKVEPNNTDTTHFFSIANFFTSEIKTLETIPYPIYQITSNANGTKDSSAIDKTLFASLAKQFIACDISDSIQKKTYKEVAFNDNSTKSITLNYTTYDKDLPIQSIDVLFDEETNHVRRVFIRKVLHNKDSSATVLFSWKANKSFTIIKSVIKKDGTKYTEQQYVNWNDSN
jgi:hypothetical protein